MFKYLLPLAAIAVSFGISANAQTAPKEEKKTVTIAERTPMAKPAKPSPEPKKARGPVFRPTKEQIKAVQAMLKEKGLYSGEATGTYDPETRTGIKALQKENGLKQTGTLNRATLEKFGIELTESQKAIPVAESSFEKDAAGETKEKAPRKAPFRATADQINQAQRILKERSLYAGEETGKLNQETRDALKKFQADNDLKPTGTLNKATLEKLGIELTDKQKAQ